MNRNDMLVQVAVLYYEQDMTQTDIAKKLGISRPTVASMLNQARAEGIVKISIVKSYSDLLGMQESLREKYALKHVRIAPKDAADPKAEVGILCADYLEHALTGDENLGISYGTTVFEYIKHANHKNFQNLTIVPLMGGVELANEALHSNHLCFVLSNKYNCRVNYFYAPFIAESREQQAMLRDSKFVETALETARNVTIGVFGVGNPRSNSTYEVLGYMSRDELQTLEEKEVIGDICASFYNEAGEEVSTPLSDRLIGLTLSEIKKIPEALVLATGSEKLPSVRTLIEHGYVETLIIDYDLAKALL